MATVMATVVTEGKDNMSFIDGEAMKLTEILVPWIAVLFSIMIAFWLKDFAQNFMVGLKFRMNSAFNEGDKVILDGNDALIVKTTYRTRE